MPKDYFYKLRDLEVSRESEQSRSLLAQDAMNDDKDAPTPAYQSPPFLQSSLSRTDTNSYSRAPRTMSQVRFDVGEDKGEHTLNGHTRTPSQEGGDWSEAEDDISGNHSESRRSSAGQRAPLLTNVEAPSVTVAEDLDFNADGILEIVRQKSGTM